VLIQSRATRDVAYTRLRQLLDLPLDEPLALSTALPMPPGSDPVPVRRTAGTLADATAAPRTQVPGARRGTPSGPPLDGAPLDGGPLARTVADPIYTTVDVDVAEVLAEDATVLAAVDSAVTAADTAARGRAPARQAVENVTAQRNLLRAARAQRLPGVQLSTNYQRFAYPAGDGISLPTALNQFFPNWTVTLGVSVPILTGGRIRGDELIAEANLREAQQTSRQVEELAALDARLAVSQLAQAEAAWRASAGTAGEAERAYTIAEVRFREGIATQVDLADTRLLLQQAQANAATAARDREVARLRLQLLRDLPLGQGTTGGQQQNGAGARPGGGFAPSGGGAAPQQPRGGQQQPGQQGPGGFQQASTGGVP
jgi:outer membrane protein TolC